MEHQPMMLSFFFWTTMYISCHKVGGKCKCEKRTKKSEIKTHRKPWAVEKKSRRLLFVFPWIYPKILHLRAYFTYTMYKMNIVSLSTLRQCSMRIPTNNADIYMPWILIVATFLVSFRCWFSFSSSVSFCVFVFMAAKAYRFPCSTEPGVDLQNELLCQQRENHTQLDTVEECVRVWKKWIPKLMYFLHKFRLNFLFPITWDRHVNEVFRVNQVFLFVGCIHTTQSFSPSGISFVIVTYNFLPVFFLLPLQSVLAMCIRTSPCFPLQFIISFSVHTFTRLLVE